MKKFLAGLGLGMIVTRLHTAKVNLRWLKKAPNDERSKALQAAIDKVNKKFNL